VDLSARRVVLRSGEEIQSIRDHHRDRVAPAEARHPGEDEFVAAGMIESSADRQAFAGKDVCVMAARCGGRERSCCWLKSVQRLRWCIVARSCAPAESSLNNYTLTHCITGFPESVVAPASWRRTGRAVEIERPAATNLFRWRSRCGSCDVRIGFEPNTDRS